MRTKIAAQSSAKTTIPTRKAPAAPVAPQREPKTITSGSTTIVSAPCVQMRSFGRPIVTGNDFVQPTTSCTAAVSRKSRAAFDAPAYRAP